MHRHIGSNAKVVGGEDRSGWFLGRHAGAMATAVPSVDARFRAAMLAPPMLDTMPVVRSTNGVVQSPKAFENSSSAGSETPTCLPGRPPLAKSPWKL